jgi:hypothetical protein
MRGSVSEIEDAFTFSFLSRTNPSAIQELLPSARKTQIMPPQPSSLLVLPLPRFVVSFKSSRIDPYTNKHRVVPSSANSSSTPMPTDPSPNSQPKQTRHSIRHRNGPRQADLNDGQEKLAAAFKGAHIIYALTDF